MKLMTDYEITDFFIGGISPEGSGYEIEDERPEASDLKLIPDEMAALSSSGLSYLGLSESDILAELLCDDTPPDISADFPCVSVDACYNVYPNIAEPAEWWCLGNLKTDGVDSVIKAYRDGTPPGMTANKTVSVSELAYRFGRQGSTKLYTKGDLICRFMHQWGLEYMRKNERQ